MGKGKRRAGKGKQHAPHGRLMFSIVRLDAGWLGEDEQSRKWVQVALEGTYLGYLRGTKPFTFSREVFQQAVDNLRAHPSYSPAGDADIIRWDFEHATEPPFYSEEELRATGLPAQGWSSDLKVVDGFDENGNPRAELWALTRFLEPARSYILEGKYKNSSVALDFDHVDPVTGARVGAYVTSIALTNDPFIQGMQTVAANRIKNEGKVAAGVGWYEQADSPSDAFRDLKDLFGLGATAEVPALMVELGKLEQWVASGTMPIGIEVEDILGAMRKILGLPALSTGQQVLDNARQIVTRLLEESGTSSTGDVVPPANAPPPPQQATANRRSNEMDLLKILASMLGVRENDEAVRDAVKDLVELHGGMTQAMRLSAHTAPSVVLKAAGESVNARDKLSALLKALGVEDADGAVNRVAQLMESAQKLKEVMPELEGLRADSAEVKKVAEEQDVTDAMASYSLQERDRDALVLLRRMEPAKFAEKYPKRTAPRGVTASHARQLREPATNREASGGEVIDLTIYEGNVTQRAIAHLTATQAGFDKLSREAQFKAAAALKRRPGVILHETGAA